MSEIKFEKEILTLIKKRHLIPDEFWIKAENGKDVIWFLDREDGTAGSYETSQERFGLTKEGDIIYGYSSGCSCWSGWERGDYEDSLSYKEFTQKRIGGFKKNDYGGTEKEEGYDLSFSENWQDECFSNLNDYLLLLTKNLNPKKVLEAKNSEVRRYLIKRVGYEKIKDKVKAVVLHKDGENELLKFETGEMYVKVKDSSTAREYLLYVEGHHTTCRSAIAWTFGLRADEYKPIIET